jgi:Lar family restriction alleviation protein
MKITPAELKPCPFCGGKAVAYKEPSSLPLTIRYKAICEDCSGQMYRGTMNEVVKAWNRRAALGGDHDG